MSYGNKAIQERKGFCEADGVSAVGFVRNPLGVLRHTETTLMMASGYMVFQAPEPLGIGGLCQVKHGLTDILAVASDRRGEGNFTKFLDALEPLAGTVTFWSMMSDDLADILRGRGYKTVMLRDKFNESHRCMTKTLWGDGENVRQPHDPVQTRDGDGGPSPVPQGGGEGVGVGSV